MCLEMMPLLLRDDTWKKEEEEKEEGQVKGSGMPNAEPGMGSVLGSLVPAWPINVAMVGYGLRGTGRS